MQALRAGPGMVTEMYWTHATHILGIDSLKIRRLISFSTYIFAGVQEVTKIDPVSFFFSDVSKMTEYSLNPETELLGLHWWFFSRTT